ncbi:hypothetical protein F8N49_23240 [Pseudomonas sp. GXM4]|uniref:hypothetical protein n=1 Tax=Pseudomonas sp. GXM4 TaxID=2651867 RepID=UPI00124DE9AA|nr:hypothetical protein [Pseudomonas sp. GXM4]KAB2518033.1 hypothetical protein F8N49_23240 [Pseudomonas sp. GXM4]
MLDETCYMCEQPATSVEHVPPKCIFPEFKDAQVDLRRKLITVPSCDDHNAKKSRDDEFLMVSIAGIIGNNSIGYEHYQGKIQRALRRTSYRLLGRVFLKGSITRIGDENKFLDLIWGTPDYPRLVDCFTHIAYGIYRHHFQVSFDGKIKVFLGFLHSANKNQNSFKEFIAHRAEIDLKEKHGSNQGVFYYRLAPPDQFGLSLMHLCFYENVNVYVSLIPAGTGQIFDLGMEMIKGGIETTINLEGKEYKFNLKDG